MKGTENLTGFLDWDVSISWPEAKDNPLGSGIYTGQCPECGKFFLGHKQRGVCTACYVEPEKPVICEHGRLKRQCNECDMQDEIDTLTEQNKQLVEANKELCAMLAKWYKADFTDPTLGITELKSATWDVILKHNN